MCQFLFLVNNSKNKLAIGWYIGICVLLVFFNKHDDFSRFFSI